MTNLIHRLRERARIRRQINTRKSVQEGKPDRIADLLEEAANEIEALSQMARDADNALSSRFDSDRASPSEWCRYLASYLEQNQERYTEHDQACIHVDELAWVIHEFYETLP